MTAYERWWWAQFLVALDRAGYRIVRKPELCDVGRPGG